MLKTVWKKIKQVFGISKNTKYVKDYLDMSNMRSGIYMSAIIFVLEIWLLIRQTDKYIVPAVRDGSPFFQTMFVNTSNFWLLMSLGAAMLFYCLQFTSKKYSKTLRLLTFITAGISLVFVGFLPFEFKWSLKFEPLSKAIAASLKITMYALVFLFDISVILATIYRKKGGDKRGISSMMVISFFALACLAFGMMVSFSDFASTSKFASGEYQHKQIICFLMMSIYVGCLLIWKPYISVGILGTIFIGFYLLIDGIATWVSGGREVPEGDKINYITFFISLTMICISTYDQRVSEAKKDEELEILATRDILTGLCSFEYFTTLISRRLEDENTKVDEWIFLFMDITSFKIFNDQRGFEEGNIFLKEVGEVLSKTFTKGLISRQSDDHYVVFAYNENIEDKLNYINKEIEHLDLDIRPGIKVGGYVLRDKSEDPHLSVEKARYACAELKTHGSGNFSKYDQEMHDNYRLIQYIVRHIDEAIEKEYIKAYYQPVMWSKDQKLCGAEALARWIDPKYGFLSPGVFVPALEDAQLVYKLDIAVLRIVCQDIKRNIDNGLPLIPVSINFSRLDFVVMDVVKVIDDTINEFGIPHDLFHVEITESALMDDEDVLKNAMDRLHTLGYEVWLDDFGSGYSSFNVLKDFGFDMLKLDMKFLVGFENNKNSKILIENVVKMADQIGIKTLCEGVETEEQAQFLKKVNCGRLQGYRFGKPMSYFDIKDKIVNKEYLLADELKKKA